MARTLHEIGIGADTEPFERGIREGIIDPLELSEEALEDLGAAAEDAGKVTDEATTKMEDGLVDVGDAGTTAGKDVESAGKRIEESLRRTQEETKRAKDELKNAGKEGSKGLKNVGEDAGKVGDDIAETFSTVADAVGGDMKAMSELGQDALGGIATMLPKLGPAAAVAGAALQLVTAELVKQQKEAEKFKGKLTSAYKDAAAAGQEYITEASFFAEVQDLMWNPKRAEEWSKAQQDAATLGLDELTLLRAKFAADIESQKKVLAAIEAGLDANPNGFLSVSLDRRDFEALSSEWKGITAATLEATEQAQKNREVQNKYFRELIEQDAAAFSRVDELGNRLYELGDGTKIMIDVDTGIASQKVDRFGKELMDVIEPGGHPRNIHLNLDLGKTQFELDEFMRKNRDLKIDVEPRLKSKGFLGPV